MWFAYAVTLPRPAVAPVGRALLGLGATGLQEDLPAGVTPKFRQPWDTGPMPRAPKKVRLRAWFDARPTEDAVAGALAGWAAEDPEWAEQAEEDWAEDWKRNFQPVTISERLVVAAPWHDLPGALIIEPGNAFGTGEHPTTRACLRAVDRFARPGGTLLDVGCGSGILALAGAKLGMVARGTDIDPDAVVAALAAARQNGLDVAFDTTPIADVEGRYDLVVANLFAEVLVALAPDLLRVSAGPIALAGILADRADTVRAAFASRPVLDDTTEEGWVSLWYGGP
ncbi:MAG: 50S ribosomal protein L11 methyltransferase [Pseudomonadota bacterium]|nr:50S ribosomal protein L11 methyltransferase [Pseudomonadota bacterium]